MSDDRGTTARVMVADRHDRVGDAPATGTLLRCGVVAGVVYVGVGLLQIAVRDGYDITRHSLSLMSNGDLGWIQITNFVLTGLLVVACAIGVRRMLPPGNVGAWGPRLLGVHGLGLIAAGIFVADPYDGFPPGTPPGVPQSVSWHGALHLVAAMVTFLTLIAACLVFARLFARRGRPGQAAYAATTGVCYLAACAALFSGSGQAWIAIAFNVAVVLGWLWIAITAAQLQRGAPSGSSGG